MRKTVIGVILVLVGLVTAQPVAAQTALERLERQIRGRLDQATSESSTTPGVQQAVAQVVPPKTSPLEESGYVGVLADDVHGTGRGVRIVEVRPGGPADKGGLRQSDLVVGVDGKRIGRMGDLAAALSAYPVGRQATFEVQRDDQRLQFRVVLGHRDRLDDDLLVAEVPSVATSAALADGGPAVAPPNAPVAAKPPKGPELVFEEAQSPQDDGRGNWRAELDTLRRRVEQLEQRVLELEKANNSPTEGG